MYDAAIIGTGPAGLSAALNLQIHRKNFIWIGSKNLSDKVYKAECISNYPGFINVSGQQLREAFLKQINAMNIEIFEGMVTSILPTSNSFNLFVGIDFFETRSIILATGSSQVAQIKGEADFVGRGVSYCATCDGNLYRGKTIAVICSNPRFEHEVKFLADLAGKVYFFPTYKNVRVTAENIEQRQERVAEVQGVMRADAVVLRSGERIGVDGVFCLRDSISLASLLPGLAMQDAHIAVDSHMACSISGVYAAGDCTGRPYQYTKAVGEGNVAAHSVIAYLAKAQF